MLFLNNRKKVIGANLIIRYQLPRKLSKTHNSKNTNRIPQKIINTPKKIPKSKKLMQLLTLILLKKGGVRAAQ